MIILIIFAFIISFFLYFLPTRIASKRKSTNAAAVLVINLLTGWTVIGRFLALFLAYTGEETEGS